MGWIGVDLDGTLASWDAPWDKDYCAIGRPIGPMIERVKQWLADGRDVRIFTARCDPHWRRTDGSVVVLDIKQQGAAMAAIQEWCFKHIGKRLEVTNVKDYYMEALYDDRAVAVERDSGRILGGREV